MNHQSSTMPASRRARVMQASRDGWKQRAADKQRTIRSLRVSVRDLRASRDRWKAVALRASAELQKLQGTGCPAGPAGDWGAPRLGGA